jgi:hypothetical protein
MKVFIKDPGMQWDIKSKGVEIDVGDNNGHLGDLYVTWTNLIWCRGKVAKANGVRLSWPEFMKLMENLPQVRKLLKKL